MLYFVFLKMDCVFEEQSKQKIIKIVFVTIYFIEIFFILFSLVLAITVNRQKYNRQNDPHKMFRTKFYLLITIHVLVIFKNSFDKIDRFWLSFFPKDETVS